ncbi:hypothetical protein B0T20DRAFT_161369 [Sordaria brevicollis]|uniref:Uncharacterized protein n=1 Tax=Sordaria brevicollis TaxID=83679 RepID=A0AAE0PJF8_SORBR|nr:hypothetical protein B0T20DRAFT_161369 [Sordaria brevicollis]
MTLVRSTTSVWSMLVSHLSLPGALREICQISYRQLLPTLFDSPAVASSSTSQKSELLMRQENGLGTRSRRSS